MSERERGRSTVLTEEAIFDRWQVAALDHVPGVRVDRKVERDCCWALARRSDPLTGLRVLSVVLHVAVGVLVRGRADLRAAKHPVVVVAGYREQRLSLGRKRKLTEDLLRCLACPVVKVVPWERSGGARWTGARATKEIRVRRSQDGWVRAACC